MVPFVDWALSEKYVLSNTVLVKIPTAPVPH